ncbi:hypothetical protein ABW20_dc0106763 [Dactylellina cionopaga]|nr:hypothetical protein ABW20_dc0106763 [Dactylellina cionopaga]
MPEDAVYNGSEETGPEPSNSSLQSSEDSQSVVEPRDPSEIFEASISHTGVSEEDENHPDSSTEQLDTFSPIEGDDAPGSAELPIAHRELLQSFGEDIIRLTEQSRQPNRGEFKDSFLSTLPAQELVEYLSQIFRSELENSLQRLIKKAEKVVGDINSETNLRGSCLYRK